MKKTIKRAVSVLCLVSITTQIVSANSTSNLQNQQSSIEQQIRDAQKDVENAKDDREKVVAELEVAEAEFQKANAELETINSQVTQVKAELSAAEEAYEEATIKRDQQYENLKDRLSFMYEYGDVGYAQVLFESENVSDFFKRVEYINAIIAYDKDILSSLEETQKQIDEEIAIITQKKAEVESLQAQQKAKTQELQAKQANKEKALAKINSDIDAQQDVIYALEEENAKVEAMIKEAQRKAAQSGGNSSAYTYSGGQLAWPAPQYSRLSSDYGSRIHPITGKQQFHTGIDLASGYGTDLVAAEAGVVITASYLNGYGYTVIIDHGNGLSTLYAHCSTLDVKVGDTVTRGQRVAGTGSTGNSTGNHLHFEVRLNGSHTDPKPYLGL